MPHSKILLLAHSPLLGKTRDLLVVGVFRGVSISQFTGEQLYCFWVTLKTIFPDTLLFANYSK